MVDDNDDVRATAFALLQEDGTSLELLDVDFFDDIEVALLIRIPQFHGQRACLDSFPNCATEGRAERAIVCAAVRYALATVRYREVALTDMPGTLDQSKLPVCIVLLLSCALH